MIPVISAGFLLLGGVLLSGFNCITPNHLDSITILGWAVASFGALILFLELARSYLPKIKAWLLFECVGEDGEEDNKHDEKPQ